MIEAFLDGDDSAETLAELRRRIERWLATDSTLDLARAVGLGCRSYARKARRNALLRQAAATLPGRTGTRAKALLSALRTFEVRRLDSWRLRGIPADATEIDRALFQALRFGPIPRTERRMRDILSDA